MSIENIEQEMINNLNEQLTNVYLNRIDQVEFIPTVSNQSPYVFIRNMNYYFTFAFESGTMETPNRQVMTEVFKKWCADNLKQTPNVRAYYNIEFESGWCIEGTTYLKYGCIFKEEVV